MGKTDFTDIRMQHIAWRVKLDEFLKGKQSMTEEEATSHEACEVGKWLYSVGLEKYGMMEEVQELEKIHIELHITVKKIMSLKQSGNSHAETDFRGKYNKSGSFGYTPEIESYGSIHTRDQLICSLFI